MKNKDQLIKILNEKLDILDQIQNESSYDRWRSHTAKFIKKYIGIEEESRFKSRDYMVLDEQKRDSSEYLKGLIDSIKNNQELFDEFPNEGTILHPSEMEKIWGKDYENKVLIFLSHKAEYKKQVSKIKDNLKAKNISCFIAHQDIHPTLIWQKEIIKALNTMHIFVGFITDDFHTGSWTDQEIGYAYSRGVQRIFIKIGKSDPQGFISSEQAISSDWDSIHTKIIEHLEKEG